MVEGFHEENGSLKIDVGAAETNEYGGVRKTWGAILYTSTINAVTEVSQLNLRTLGPHKNI